MIVSRSLSNNIINQHAKLYEQKTKCANATFVEADSAKVNFAEYRCDESTFAKDQCAKSVAVAQQTLLYVYIYT